MVKFWAAACALAALVAVVNCAHSHHAPSLSPALAPTMDCSQLIYNLADCIPYLSKGNNETEPKNSCCSGLKSVLKTDAHCVCEAIKSSAQLGVELNISRALALPSACGVAAPSLRNCGISIAPGATPVAAPVTPPKSSPGSAPSPQPPAARTPAPAAPTIGGGGGMVSEVPAPSPLHSGAYSTPTSFVVFVSVAVASFSCISA